MLQQKSNLGKEIEEEKIKKSFMGIDKMKLANAGVITSAITAVGGSIGFAGSLLTLMTALSSVANPAPGVVSNILIACGVTAAVVISSLQSMGQFDGQINKIEREQRGETVKPEHVTSEFGGLQLS